MKLQRKLVTEPYTSGWFEVSEYAKVSVYFQLLTRISRIEMKKPSGSLATIQKVEVGSLDVTHYTGKEDHYPTAEVGQPFTVSVMGGVMRFRLHGVQVPP